MSSSTCPVRFAVTLLVAALAALALPPPAAAQILCQWTEDKTPADPPPANLWTALEPAYTEGSLEAGCEGQFGSPTCEGRDTTFYSRALSPWFGTPYWQSIDIKQGYAFLATSLGFQIWNLNGSMAESPDRLTYKDIRSFAPVNTGPDPHQYFQVMGMEASEDGTLAAVTGGYSTGMLIVKTENKVTPSVLYQDPATETPGRAGGGGVHVQTISGRVYGFLASGGGGTVHVNTRGLWAYDMTSASQLATTPCVDPRPENPNPQCAGVFKGRYSTNRLSHVDGAGDDVNGHFLVASGGSEDGQENTGFTVWKVNDPAAPVQVLSGHSGNRIDGVALWQEGTKFFLALANRGPFGAGSAPKGQMYDVTCIKTGTCGSLPSLLVYEFPLAGYTPGFVAHDSVVQDSTDGGGGQWVYFGFREGQGAQGLQMDWLFNVTGLSASNPPDEITGGNPQNGNLPQPTMQVGNPPNQVPVGYWSYMYHCHPSGSAFYQGRGGVMWGNRFYRAGHSIFDIHRQRNVSPTITVTGPATGYTGDPETFNATASNCTPTAGGWSWTASGGGQVVGGGTTASASIEWSMTGSKTVTAQNTGCPGATSVPAAIQILDPAPAIGGVSVSPTNAPICTPVTFTANNVTGQPPLTYAWTIEQGGNPVPGEGGPGNPFVWDTEGIAPGAYVGRVTVTGPGGSANATSPQVTLNPLDPLPSPGYTITNVQPPNFGTVQFHSAAATGATEWRWDFDGDLNEPVTFDLTTTDPTIGPDPVHAYTAIGTYRVWLEVRNCTTTQWVRSARLDVTITEVSPLLINQFRANCGFIVCEVNVGQPMSFTQPVEGNPDTYEYDWKGDGTFEQSSSTPVTSHTYNETGLFRPKLRIRRGLTESVTANCENQVQVTTGGPPPPPPPGPSITIVGPISREVGQAGDFIANAANCTPNPTGWTWNTAGGSGSSNTNTIDITWSSIGTKVISASNSGCAGAVDSHTVAVTDPGGPGPNPGNLVAAFTVSPADPEAGEVVTFDAGTSAGTPTGWAWTFGDGGSASGMEVTHTYAEPGVYSVGLTISKVVPGSGCGSFGQEICTHSVTQNLTVGGTGGGDCVPNDATLCLLGGRFEVTGRWHNHRNGEQGPARVYTPFSGDRTGMFWFFRPDNVELIVKALDATDPDVFPNPAFWFFYGGLSDVEYWITVTDTGDPEAEPNEYHNLPGVICGVPDTGAFPQPSQNQEPVGTGGTLFALGAAASGGDGAFDVSSISGAVSGTCTPTGDNLCLLDGRFSVEVEWHDQHNDIDGIGHPIVGTDRTGYFWFFNADNVELVTKMLNPGPPFQHFWVFWGGLSDVEYTIRVTDTVAGGPPREYHNPPGNYCGGASADAFPSP